MPESRRRKKETYTPPPAKKKGKKSTVINDSRWIVPVMVAMFVIGLLWIVIWYIDPSNPVMDSLAGWNIAVGFGFIAVGFLLSTKWK